MATMPSIPASHVSGRGPSHSLRNSRPTAFLARDSAEWQEAQEALSLRTAGAPGCRSLVMNCQLI